MKKIISLVLCMVMEIVLLTNLTGIDQQKIDLQKPENLKITAPNLKAYIFSLPSAGCCWSPSSPSPLDSVLTAFYDPDIYIKNEGTARSTGGKAKVEFFNLLTCSNLTAEVVIPPLNPGESTTVTTSHVFYIARKAEGIKLTLTYNDALGKSYSYSRVVTNCPDHF